MRRNFQSNLGIFLVFLLLPLFTTSCGKENYASIPSVPVHVELNVTTDLANLGLEQMCTIDSSSSGTSIINFHNSKLTNIRIAWTTYGNGLILYRVDEYNFQAYDRTCTYNGLTAHCRVNVNVTGFTCTCPCCKSIFMMNDYGVPEQGSIATIPMVQYQTNSPVDITSAGKLIIWK